jgi:hypothetical protein
MSVYTQLHEKMKSCETHSKLLRVAEYIANNKRELQLDDYEVERLEEAGLRRYEQIDYENAALVRNRKP